MTCEVLHKPPPCRKRGSKQLTGKGLQMMRYEITDLS